jgi:hypothetical protein
VCALAYFGKLSGLIIDIGACYASFGIVWQGKEVVSHSMKIEELPWNISPSYDLKKDFLDYFVKYSLDRILNDDFDTPLYFYDKIKSDGASVDLGGWFPQFLGVLKYTLRVLCKSHDLNDADRDVILQNCYLVGGSMFFNVTLAA